MSEKTLIIFKFDLDGTLIDGNHPEILLEEKNINSNQFWSKIAEERDSSAFENKTALYLTRFVDEINYGRMQGLTIQKIKELGSGINNMFFPGLPEFFNNIQEEFPKIEFRFHLISSGIKPMIEGSILKDYFHEICAYDLIPSRYQPDKIIGPSTTVSSGEKENIMIKLSIGNSNKQKYEFPLKDTIIVGDGITDKAMFKVGKQYGASCFGIIRNEAARVSAETFLGKSIESIHVADYRKGSDLWKAFCKAIQERIDQSFH